MVPVSNSDADDRPTRASLLERLRDPSDYASWNEFHRFYAPLIRAVASRAGLRDHDLDDLTQETWLAVIHGIPGFRAVPGVSSFRAWLRTLTFHRISEHFRRIHGRTGARERVMVQDHTAGADGDAVMDTRLSDLEQAWDTEWRKLRTELALARLKTRISPRDYQVFRMLAEGKTLAEVAHALEINRALIYVIKHRVSRKLDLLVDELEC